jgi:hypothetical protein
MSSEFVPAVIVLGGFLIWAEAAPAGAKTDGPFTSSPPALTATLTGPVDINLKWKTRAASAAGYFIEYANNLNDDFAVIAIGSANTTAFQHLHLAPQTSYFYRVLPFFGPASSVAAIMTGKTPDPKEVSADSANASEPRLPPDSPGEMAEKKTVGRTTIPNQTAPTGLTVSLLKASTDVEVKWENHGQAEDGLLLEDAPGPDGPFQAIAVLPANATFFRIYGLPPETKVCFRLRAFYFGKPSNLAEETTGSAPSANN